jgi:hypothetical protein
LYGKTEDQIILSDKVGFSEENRHLQNGEDFLEKTIAVDSNVHSGRLTLLYKNIKPPADFFNLLVGGPKTNVLTVLESLGKIQDSGTRFETVIERLTQWLGVSNRGLDADRFEMALWTVLTFSGLQTINLGRAFGKGFDLRGFDLIIIHQPTKQIAMISCTIDNKLSNKIEALLKESNSVISKMGGWTVIPVICAPIDRKDVTLGSFVDATHSGISLVLKLEIEEILAALKETSGDLSQRVIEIITRKKFPGYPDDQSVQDFITWSQDWHGFII